MRHITFTQAIHASERKLYLSKVAAIFYAWIAFFAAISLATTTNMLGVYVLGIILIGAIIFEWVAIFTGFQCIEIITYFRRAELYDEITGISLLL